MTVWEKYPQEQRQEYIRFLQVYGALSNLFRQKHGDMIPYLDSKFQETIYARVFDSENVDINNTPHDILSVFGNDRIGIGLKTWMNSKASFQKVMQIKALRDEIQRLYLNGNPEDLAVRLSQIKNDKLIMDYKRLGITESENVYHYITRDEGKFIIQETAYPLVEIDKLRDIKFNRQNNKITNLSWSDGIKQYRYTFSDQTFYMKFDSQRTDTAVLNQFDVSIIDDPFDFLMQSYFSFIGNFKIEKETDIVEVFLPLYSYRSKEVEVKSGLNAWNAEPKNKGSQTLRPLNEVYIPIPREFHKKYPDFFISDIFEFEKMKKNFVGDKKDKPEVRFHLKLPNGKKIPALVTQSNMKGLQSGSNTEYDENGKRYGQSALGQWLLVEVLGLSKREKVTRRWLELKETDSVRLWRKKDDYSIINIDFAPFGSFEKFMNDEKFD